MQLPIGTIQNLAVLRVIETGYVLHLNEQDILLHHNEIEGEALEVDQAVDVFLYLDKKGNVTATMKLPEIVIHTYGWAKVVEVIPKLGAFVDIGTSKEILVSSDDLPLFEEVWPIVGDELYVTLGKDQKDRLLALPATEGVIIDLYHEAPKELLHETISGNIYITDKEGSAFVTENGYRGFIHNTERASEPRLGELVEGRVIAVKEDGTLNVSLLPLKQDRLDTDAEAILTYLTGLGGEMNFTDKSDPNEIRDTFKMSKSGFKRALGRLMKDRKITQVDGKTQLKQ